MNTRPAKSEGGDGTKTTHETHDTKTVKEGGAAGKGEQRSDSNPNSDPENPLNKN